MITRQFTSMLSLVMVVGLAHIGIAALINRGTDSLGNRLIYDTDLNITWYDFTYQTTYRNDENPNGGWVEAGQWAAALTVYLPGVTYLTGWRLPSAGADPQSGYNQTAPEMGHLFYTELGNKGYESPDGSFPQPGWGLKNTGPFQHLTSYYYWSAERYAPGQDAAWVFAFSVGYHAGGGHTDLPYFAMAVRQGDVPCSAPIGDLNHDCQINLADLALMAASWLIPDSCPPYPLGDINSDCIVDLHDFAILAEHWQE